MYFIKFISIGLPPGRAGTLASVVTKLIYDRAILHSSLYYIICMNKNEPFVNSHACQ